MSVNLPLAYKVRQPGSFQEWKVHLVLDPSVFSPFTAVSTVAMATCNQVQSSIILSFISSLKIILAEGYVMTCEEGYSSLALPAHDHVIIYSWDTCTCILMYLVLSRTICRIAIHSTVLTSSTPSTTQLVRGFHYFPY